ncbi:MAG: glycogen-debranching protein [Parachlamydiaceae bacterium]|nr:glycogen-debranching protein [Parachlamydiaceae bacterium]
MSVLVRSSINNNLQCDQFSPRCEANSMLRLSTSSSKIPKFVATIFQGNPKQLGANPTQLDEINFAIHSTSKEMELYIYDDINVKPIFTYGLDETIHKTADVWHVLVKGLPNNKPLFYSYRNERTGGDILDPYAKGVISRQKYGIGDRDPSDYSYRPIGAIVTIVGRANSEFDWENDAPLNLAKKNLIIYEMHVRGFTKHPSSQSKAGGTFSGIVEKSKIEHLKSIGINAVELQPIHEFNEMNYGDSWGYNSINFFSPMNRYSHSCNPQDVINEFKYMVRELHKNGIEVILDVVFNHTGEGNKDGPIHSFKALDENAYYIINSDGYHVNTSGVGNTLNCNHPVTHQMIIDSLKYWVEEMHVDGFRFDLASVFNRDGNSSIINNSPLLDAIISEPTLTNVKLIAEPWDPEVQQNGVFVAHDPRWQEWNNQYRNAARRFIKGDVSAKGIFANALCGSSSMFKNQSGSPINSINFITAHDGFTLKDLVTFNYKHNENNENENTDGENENYSWNCGIEGNTNDTATLKLRAQQMKNLHLALMTSTGTPMVLMGDEYGHTKHGNNNTYKQEALNQFKWNQLSENKGFSRFFGLMNLYRSSHEILRKEHFLEERDIDWHGQIPYSPNWEEPLLAFTLKGEDQSEQLTLAFNPSDKTVTFTLPPAPEGKNWHVVVNTSQLTPLDFLESEQTLLLEFPTFDILPYSSILLEAKKNR